MTSPTVPSRRAAEAPPSARSRPELPALDVLVPRWEHVPPDPGEARLAELYAYPAPARGAALVRTNMVTSLDGAAWGPDHRSGSINDAADARVFRVLRALADVVLVGAGTARTEGYTALDVPRGLEHLRTTPIELALVSASGQVPAALARSSRPPYVLTGVEGARAARDAVPDDRVLVVGPDHATGADEATGPEHTTVPEHTTGLDLAAGLAALAERGLRRVLCEGGPRLLADLLRADLVDELCLTTTPVLVGPGPGRVVAGAPLPAGPGAHLAPRGARLAHLLHSDGTTIARWRVPLG